jgi:hypothetical protein
LIGAESPLSIVDLERGLRIEVEKVENTRPANTV